MRHRPERLRRASLSVLVGAVVFAACSSDDGDTGPVATPAPPSASDAVATTSTATSETVVATFAPDTAAPATDAEPTTSEVAADPYVIDTTLGPVEGGPSALDGVRNFLAIPYAAAPTGDDAWRPPQPREPWTEPFDATAGGASCPQLQEGVTASVVITPDPDPDCLTLSVWSPEGAEELPVMFWIHGGGFSNGSAHEPYYTGDDLASEGVVVVNVNYRLGPQGFLATADLQSESEDGSVGNYGFLDQQAGLRWVRDNISAFGGDPDRVTIFGESAGGFAVCGHLASEASRELFAQAIVQSGGGCDRLVPLESALDAGSAFLERVDCADVACLREKSDEEIIAATTSANGGFDAALVADGVTLTRTAVEQAENGEFGDVPVLIGSNADEATLFTLGAEEPDDAGLIELASAFTEDPEALVALYPAEEFETSLARYQAMFTDVRFTCPTLAFASAVDSSFVYHYTYVSADNPLGLGATHGAEIAGLFNHPEGIEIDIERTDEGARLSDDIQAAWTEFARSGDPGDEFDPYADGGLVTLLTVPLEQVDVIRDGRCDQVSQLSTVRR